MPTANYIGVYSSVPDGRRQSGTASRKHYWFAWDDLLGGYFVQSLDAAYKPLGTPLPIDAEEFSKNFKLEDNIFVTPIAKLEIADRPGKTPVRLDIPEELAKQDNKSEVYQRQVEAVALDQRLRNDFATALARLQRGEKAPAINVFERLASRREGIVPAHKHTFTDFAVSLRKSRLPAVAFKFYQRALELSPEDSNAYFNMARIMFDLGDYNGTERHLQQALNLDVDFVEAQQFLDYLAKQQVTKSYKSGKTRNMPENSLP